MFSPVNAPRFTLTLPGLVHDFQVLAFHGQEALNEPYRLQVEVVSEKPDWALEDLLNRPAWLALGPMDVGLHGLMGAIQRTNSRIFQNLAVPQILARLLEEHGILEGAYRLALGPTPYPARDYCVQYGESDLHFLNRLCEEEGIHYHFEHRPDGAVLVFGDDATSFPRLAATPYHPGSGQVADHPVVRGLEVGVQTRSTQLILRDQDPLQPRWTTAGARATAIVSTPFPGNCPFAPCLVIPSRACLASRARWSPVRREKRSIAMPWAGSRSSFIGIVKGRQTNAPVAGYG